MVSLQPEAQATAGAQQRSRWLARFAWSYYGYLLFVILFGAWVRISGSGAGCGSSWPTCHGAVIPRSNEVATWIEYSHRVTSALLGVFSVVLVAWVFAARRSVRCKVASLLTLALVLVEALVGAGLVLGELVADDSSATRAVVIAFHLANTLVLAAAAGLTAHWAGRAGDAAPRLKVQFGWFLSLMLVMFVVVSMAGAVTALGDTLFPVAPTEGEGLFAHVRSDLSASAHFLVRLRIIHPILAGLLIGLLLVVLHLVDEWVVLPERLWRVVLWARALVWVQVVLGLGNILLHAPAFMQLGHLLFAHLLWLSLVLLTAGIWTANTAAESPSD